MIALLLSLYLLPPEAATRLVAAGDTWMTRTLLAVVQRESQGVRVGEHPGDRWCSEQMRRNAIRTGWLSERCRGPGYSVHGAHGLSYSYNARYAWLSWLCWPAAFDIPIVSALAAKRKAQKLCRRRRRNDWCPR